jgi:predicted transcriptional regulator of viral defense system
VLETHPSSMSHPVDWAISELAQRQHGIVARGQLRDLGYGNTAIEARVRRGSLLRLHRGVYAVGHRKLTAEGRWTAAVLAAGPGAALSHRSAAGLWGLLPRWRVAPEVTRPRRFRPAAGVIAHRSVLLDDEVEKVDEISVTSVSRTLFDLSAVLPRRQLERAMNEAEVLRLTSRVSVQALLDRYPRRRGSAALRHLLDEDAVSLGVTKRELEARFAAVLDAHGVPAPRRNADVAVRGRFFNVDCLWRRERVAVELDGREVHGTHRAFENDRQRDRLLVVDGWRVMRVTWAQLRDEPEAVIEDLKQLLAGRNAN